MARNDYIPRGTNDFLAWHDNFQTQVAALMATFELTQPDVDAVASDNAYAHEKATGAEAAKAAQQAATADRRETFAAAESNARSLANRLKAHAAYSEALGQQLGIVGPEDTTDLTNEKPTLTAESVNKVKGTANCCGSLPPLPQYRTAVRLFLVPISSSDESARSVTGGMGPRDDPNSARRTPNSFSTNGRSRLGALRN